VADERPVAGFDAAPALNGDVGDARHLQCGQRTAFPASSSLPSLPHLQKQKCHVG
jgi:hypothetical protein